MKGYMLEFVRRGLVACGFGPLVLAVLYLILQQQINLQVLTVNEVCLGIISLTVLAFVAGGMNVVYQIEEVPLMVAILIHGVVLYVTYLATYLVNGWLEWGWTPVLVFSIIFLLVYLVIWVVIYHVTKKRTKDLNDVLKLKQQKIEG